MLVTVTDQRVKALTKSELTRGFQGISIVSDHLPTLRRLTLHKASNFIAGEGMLLLKRLYNEGQFAGCSNAQKMTSNGNKAAPTAFESHLQTLL